MREDLRRWFASGSYQGSRYAAEQLAAQKDGQKVSVVLPAKNEAATVGQIVSALRTRLVEAVPLLDEIIVIDSNSTDATSAVAAAAGAKVARQEHILPELGNVPGKGEALWKSLTVATGDIVMFIDADLHDFDPQFAVGMLGPLLTEPRVHFVKSCYDRPLNNGVTVMPAGGGRVTELVARPLLNLFWPELAGIVQPLAGEYAARRSLLERIPFVSGYGVEIGMLIDVVEAVGLEGMAQVDLGVRCHRNATDADLSKMAMQVQLTVQSRLFRSGLVTAAPASAPLTQFLRNGDRFIEETCEVEISERPPMIEITDYRLTAGKAS